MSDAKRDQSAFRHTAAASHAVPPRVAGRAPAATAKLQALNLELLELAPPWGSAPREGRDPYNAVGSRAQKSSGVAVGRR